MSSPRPKRHIGPKGLLTTAHNFVEDFLGSSVDYRGAAVPKAMRSAQLKHKTDRQQERGKLLRAALNDEALRRMSRKAGIASAGRKEGESLFTELRRIVDVALFNITRACVILCHHYKKRTVSEAILKEALATLGHSTVWCPGREVRKCDTLRASEQNKRARAKAKGMPASKHKGTLAEREIKHEMKNSFCVYFEKSPIAKLFKHAISEQDEHLPAGGLGQQISETIQRDPDDPPIKLSIEAFHCLWFVIESLTQLLLDKAAHIVQKTTGGTRKTVLPKDLFTVLETLFPNMPVFHGKPRGIIERGGGAPHARDSDDGDDGGDVGGDDRPPSRRKKPAVKESAGRRGAKRSDKKKTPSPKSRSKSSPAPSATKNARTKGGEKASPRTSKPNPLDSSNSLDIPQTEGEWWALSQPQRDAITRAGRYAGFKLSFPRAKPKTTKKPPQDVDDDDDVW